MTIAGKLHFVSAGAGSGKTFRLTQILREQLVSGQVRPAGVIATTFTRKAATELRERVRADLLDAREHRLAIAMGQARIGTVNSVCGGLLERFAFEAGRATEQQVLEEEQANDLIRRAIDAATDGPEVAGLIRIAGRLGIEEWQKELQSLVNHARANDVDPADLARFAKENAHDLLGHFPKVWATDLSVDLLQAIGAAMPALVAQAQSGGKKNTATYVGLLQSLEKAIGRGEATWAEWVKLSKTLPEAALKPIAEPLNAIAARVAAHPELHADVTNYLQQIFTLCARALNIHSEQKRELGVLDFTDQEHLLLKVLEQEDVASVLRAEIDLLLVDEFQDTSPIQLALFLKLASFAKRVFWVGDIKQAIYGFRGSDTALMLAILEALPGWGGTKEILGESWRSRPPLVKLVNAVFAPAFSGSMQREEVELAPKRDDALAGPVLLNWILGGGNKGQEHAALADGVRRLVESGRPVFDRDAGSIRPVRFGDIAILSRSHDGVAGIAQSLRAANVPAATAQPGLMKTPEATLALACLRRLNDASDTIATAEILSLADSLEPEMWVADRLRHLAAKGDPDTWREASAAGGSLHPILGRIARMRDELPLLAPKEALQALVAECDLPARILRWQRDPSVARTRLANLEALLELAAQYEDLCRNAQHAASITGLIIWLNELRDSDLDPLAQPAIDAVKVMTHHAAKGLEWPVVVLTDLGARVRDRLWSISARSRGALDVSAPLRDRFLRYWPWPFGQQKKLGVADDIALTNTAKAFRAAAVEEGKRLLYVSMTRARDLLVLARSKRKPSGEWLETVEAPWLLPPEGADHVVTPDGEKIEAETWLLDPPDSPQSAVADGKPIHWFPQPAETGARLPLVFNPSSAAPRAIEVVESVRIGERIPIGDGVDMTDLGTAIHNCIAVAFTDPQSPLTSQEAGSLLAAMRAGDKISTDAVLRQIEALKVWLGERWAGSRVLAEWPIEGIREGGQVLRGRTDMLVSTPRGWILLDHKANPSGPERWPEVAKEHGGQLAEYAAAIEKASGMPVIESWIFLPVAGGAVSFKCC
jgi:ATP-dependent exoDNAse (exonuclease V) beta subunit